MATTQGETRMATQSKITITVWIIECLFYGESNDTSPTLN